MARIPDTQIEYSENVPGAEVGGVRAPTRVDTGISRLAEGLERLGRSFEQVQQANDVMELSARQRDIENIHNSRLLGLENIKPDDDLGIAELKRKSDSDIEKVISSTKSADVQRALRIHANNESPRWGLQWQGEVLQKKGQYAEDRFNVEGEQCFDKGELDKYYKLLHNALATHVISQPKFDFLVQQAPVNSALHQARILLAHGTDEKVDPDSQRAALQQADGLLDGIKDDALDDKQLDYKRKFKSAIKESRTQNVNGVLEDVISSIYDNADKGADVRLAVGETGVMKVNNIREHITPQQYNEYRGMIKKFETGDEKAEGKNEGVSVLDEVRRGFYSRRGDPENERVDYAEEALKKVDAARHNLTPAEYKEFLTESEAFQKGEKTEPKKTANALDRLETEGRIDKDIENVFLQRPDETGRILTKEDVDSRIMQAVAGEHLTATQAAQYLKKNKEGFQWPKEQTAAIRDAKNYAREMLVSSYSQLPSDVKLERHEKLSGPGGIQERLENFIKKNAKDGHYPSAVEIRDEVDKLIDDALIISPDRLRKLYADAAANTANNKDPVKIQAEVRKNMDDMGYVLPPKSTPTGKTQMGKAKPAPAKIPPPMGWKPEEWGKLTPESQQIIHENWGKDPEKDAQVLDRLYGGK